MVTSEDRDLPKKVSLFVTCLADQLRPEVAWGAIRVLEKLGIEVAFDSRQTCCGQPGYNSGFHQEARRVSRHFLDVFRRGPPLVVPSGSCCAMIRHGIPSLFPEGSKERETALEIAARTYEFSQFLVDVVGVDSTGARFPHPVTYHDSCHLLRELGVREQPRQLIRSVLGIDYRETSMADRCCGFGGLFAVDFPEVSAAIASDKIAEIEASGAAYVVSSDVGCLSHLDGLLRRTQSPVKTLHLAELLSHFDD